MPSAALPLLAFPLLLSVATPRSTSPAPSSTSPAPSSTPFATPSSSPLDLHSYLPQEWSSFCDVRYDVDDDVNATIICHVTQQVPVLWRLADLRSSLNITLVESTNLTVGVRLECGEGGRVSLPFPFRAPGLVKLTVRSCGLLDKWAEFNSTVAAGLGDWLRQLDVRHCVWLNDPAHLQRLLKNVRSLSSHYDCGQDSTLVTLVFRNNSNSELPHSDPCERVPQAFRAVNLTYPRDLGILLDSVPLFQLFWNHSRRLGGLAEQCALSLEPFRSVHFNLSGFDLPAEAASQPPSAGSSSVSSSTENPNRDVKETFISLLQYNTVCRFERLQVLDESWSPALARKHFKLLAQNTQFPRLRVLNYSHTALPAVPEELREWRRYFSVSPLQVVDLSHCLIRDVGHIPPDHNDFNVSTVLDLTFNRLTRLTLDMLESWALVPDLLVDVRHNPLHCHCHLTPLLTQLRNRTWASAPGRAVYRDMVTRMTCHAPARLKGRTLTSLTPHDLDCPVMEGDTAALEAGMGVLGVMVVVLAVLLALAVRYRKEVRILMYTRVNILLPCGRPPLDCLPEKTYDAFVAYAHQDSDWVVDSLMKRLEGAEGTPKGRRPCRLCLHQRDFVVGKPIIDNIVDCIAASRHTIVVLTNSFVRSGWAMEELQQAYRQSIEERRRHLVVVVLEEVEHSHMSPVLRRCCKTFTYLHVSDSFFWDRLLYSIQIGGPRQDTDQAQPLELQPPADASPNSSPAPAPEGNTTAGNTTAGGTDSAGSPLDTDFKHMLFSEALRTVSVDSAYSTISTYTQDIAISWDNDQPLGQGMATSVKHELYVTEIPGLRH